MNVLLLTESFPPAPVYAESRHASAVASVLSSAAHRVTVLSADRPTGARRAEEGGIRVRRTRGILPLYHYEADANAILDALGLLGGGLERRSAARRTDLIVAYGWPRALAAFVLRRQTGAPVILYLHGTSRGRFGSDAGGTAAYRAAMEAWAAQEAEAVVCPSEAARCEVVQHCAVDDESAWVLPPMFDGRRLDAQNTDPADFRSLLCEPDELLVLFAGRLTAENGIDTLIRSLPGALESGARIHVVVAGGGQEGGPSMSLAEQRGVAGRCTFAGQVCDLVLACLYGCADVLVSPGSYCPSGSSAVEAMACGLPVVGADTGALEALVEDGANGLKVCPGDPDSLTGALIWLARRRERLGEMARQAEEAAKRATALERALQELLEGVAGESGAGESKGKED